ncbi:tetratricopeptide repeat protein [Streptomyces prasinus]|uniref:tetratricopeptide repeat protein n=1 Tax=Streptomyces prasinus TaxID=67345 RepID=UPI003800E093
MVHAAGQDTAVLRQWVETLEQAAQDTADAALLDWSTRLRDALVGDEPVLACLAGLLAHGPLGTAARSWAHTYRGRLLYHSERDEEALIEFDRALAHDVRNAHAWARRGETHRQAGRYDQAVTDLTAALALDPTHAWTLVARGQAHRQVGHYEQAREDLERAVEADPEDLDITFEKLMLDTVEGGLEACAEQWSRLLAFPVSPPDEVATRFLGLFRVLLLEPEGGVAEATEEFLFANPEHEEITDVLAYLAELAAMGDGIADRARQCRRLIVERASE